MKRVAELGFTALLVAMFVCFGLHNFLQEAIMNIDGFHYPAMLAYLEMIGVCVGNYLEWRDEKRERSASLKDFGLISITIMGSATASNVALAYINYPTKIIFRSSKIIPTMLAGYVVFGKVYPIRDYLISLCVMTGLIMFSLADAEISPNFHFTGIFLVLFSVCADAFLPNLQHKMFDSGVTRPELVFYSNIICIIIMTPFLWYHQDIQGTFWLFLDPYNMAIFAVYIVIAYLAITLYMDILNRYGPMVAVLAGIVRKIMNMIISFLWWPKPFAWAYLFGTLLVFMPLGLRTYLTVLPKPRPAHRRGSDTPSPKKFLSP